MDRRFQQWNWCSIDEKARWEILPGLLCKQEIVKCGAQLLYIQERVPSDCMGNQEISSIFVPCTFCAADRPRAAEVHRQRKIYQRTTHAMGYVSKKLQFRGGSHQRIRECSSGLSWSSRRVTWEMPDYHCCILANNFCCIGNLGNFFWKGVMLRKIVFRD